MRILFLTILTCFACTWHVSGQIKSVRINYTDAKGLKQGIWKEYYKNKKLKSVLSYKNDTLNGLGKWYYESGTLQSEIYFKDGKHDGDYKTFHENGNVKMYIKLNMGMRLYLVKYGEKGSKVLEEFYKDGKAFKAIDYVDGKADTSYAVPR